MFSTFLKLSVESFLEGKVEHQQYIQPAFTDVLFILTCHREQRTLPMHGKFLYAGMIVAETRLYQDHHYTWPGSCIITVLPQATGFSVGPVNWGVVYPTMFSIEALVP